MSNDEKYLEICLKLAQKGLGSVAPNPMVGCVIVYQNKIIGEGFHEHYGGPHAEVNAIENVVDKTLLKKSTLYVNLEPCAHFGKTPPCANLIIEHQIPKVVIGCVDLFSEVAGKGIELLKRANIEVVTGVLETKSKTLNKRFFTFHTQKRPYIILKFAQTKDGFMDVVRNDTLTSSHNEKIDNWITSPSSKKIVHQWRTEEQGIMVGTNTAFNDNPQLTARAVEGKNPIRLVLDLNLRLPSQLHLFDKSVPTLVFNKQKNETLNNLEWIKIDKKNAVPSMLEILYQRNIQSVIVEGGSQLLASFIELNLWDEARVFTGKKVFEKGLKAPKIQKSPNTTTSISSDILNTYFND